MVQRPKRTGVKKHRVELWVTKGKEQNETDRIEMKWSNKRMQTKCEKKEKRERNKWNELFE